MPRKITPSLINMDSVIYAVLSPGEGYLKKLYGDYYFYDKLPRASGCFLTKEEAQKELATATEKLKTDMDKINASVGASDWAKNRARDRHAQVCAAVIVRIRID